MENLDLLNVGLKLLLGILAILLYALWKVRDHLLNFNLKIFIRDNKKFWLWTIFMITILLTITTLHPPASSSIKTMIGLDITGEPTSFLSMGWGLSVLVNSLNNKKLDKKLSFDP